MSIKTEIEVGKMMRFSPNISYAQTAFHDTLLGALKSSEFDS